MSKAKSNSSSEIWTKAKTNLRKTKDLDKDLKLLAMELLENQNSHCDRRLAWISQKSLAGTLAVSLRSVKRYLEILKAIGLFKTVQMGRGELVEYALVQHDYVLVLKNPEGHRINATIPCYEHSVFARGELGGEDLQLIRELKLSHRIGKLKKQRLPQEGDTVERNRKGTHVSVGRGHGCPLEGDTRVPRSLETTRAVPLVVGSLEEGFQPSNLPAAAACGGDQTDCVERQESPTHPAALRSPRGEEANGSPREAPAAPRAAPAPLGQSEAPGGAGEATPGTLAAPPPVAEPGKPAGKYDYMKVRAREALARSSSQAACVLHQPGEFLLFARHLQRVTRKLSERELLELGQWWDSEEELRDPTCWRFLLTAIWTCDFAQGRADSGQPFEWSNPVKYLRRHKDGHPTWKLIVLGRHFYNPGQEPYASLESRVTRLKRYEETHLDSLRLVPSSEQGPIFPWEEDVALELAALFDRLEGERLASEDARQAAVVAEWESGNWRPPVVAAAPRPRDRPSYRSEVEELLASL